jgi:membrane fusion protein, multidrug efflux system
LCKNACLPKAAEVKAGQLLFAIDAAPYQAALQTAQAQLARAQAHLAQASALAERYQPLVEAQAVSQQEYANAWQRSSKPKPM